MNRKLKFIILIIIIVSVIAYLQWKISSGNLNFHFGKDGGIFRMLQSILFLGTTFFLVMAKTKRLLFFFLGFFVSLISTIVIYLALGFSNLYTGLTFHILSCFSIIALFFYLEKLIERNKRK